MFNKFLIIVVISKFMTKEVLVNLPGPSCSKNILCSAKDSHILSTKNNSVFVILPFEILTNC